MKSALVGRSCGRRRGDILISQWVSAAWYPHEGYVRVGKDGEEDVDALNERVVG